MKVCVVGTGTMGSGIVQTMLQRGLEVWQKGRSGVSLRGSRAVMERNLRRLVEKGKLEAAARDKALSLLRTTLDYADCQDADLVIEAIVEEQRVKEEVFRELDGVCKDGAILASNTSSLSITALAAATRRPEAVVGLHFFNPVPRMQLVEVVKGQLTSESVFETVFQFAVRLGKTPVTVQDAPGFVVNRILIPMINEGIGILADGVASKEEIDASMQLGANHPMGPLALADLIGLDVCLAIMEVLHREFGDSKYRPHPLLRKMVRAGLLGCKSGKGFFDYKS